MTVDNQIIEVKIVQPNPFTGLIHSRKFLLAMLDALVSSIALVLAWFLSPDKVASVLALIGIWQPVLIAVIIGIAAEDVALSKAGAETYKADLSLAETQVAYQATDPIAKLPAPAITSGDPVSSAISRNDHTQG